MGRVKKIEDELKTAVERKVPKRRRKAKAEAVAPAENTAPTRTLTYTHGPDAVTIEDLSTVPPIRAHGATEAQAEAAYEYQRELRSRHDAQSGPVVASGLEDVTPKAEPSDDNSDLTPGRVA